jgi:DNA primase
MDVAEIDFVIKAPDGKEVEELTKKEINKSLRNKVASEQAKLEVNRPKKIERKTTKELTKKEIIKKPIRKKLNSNESKLYKKMLNDLVGTRGAYLLDESTNILGKVPTSELTTTIKSLKSGINAVVFDGTIDFDLIKLAEKSGIKNLISMNSKVVRSQKVKIITKQDLE